MSRDLNLLVPRFQEQVTQIISECLNLEVIMKPYFTIRTPWEQARIWRSTRSTKTILNAVDLLYDASAPFLAETIQSVGPQFSPPGLNGHITNAMPGYSWHQWGEAVDCFWLHDGEIIWSTVKKVMLNNRKENGYKIYAICAREAEAVCGGSVWGWDWNHVQMRHASSPKAEGMSIEDINSQMISLFGKEENSD